MSANERKKLLMSITFHVIALACVVWSLYVLIGKWIYHDAQKVLLLSFLVIHSGMFSVFDMP